MSVTGYAIRCRVEPVQTEMTADVAAGGTVLPVEWSELFSDEGGTLVINGVEMDYETSSDDDSTVTLTDPLADDVADGDPVYLMDGGKSRIDYVLDVDLGEGDPVEVPIPFEQRFMWPVGEFEDPIRVTVSDDYSRLETVPDFPPRMVIGEQDANRVEIDDTPSIRAFDATNTQTVNIDGEDNYMTGTLSTAPDGQRIEIGAGPAGGLPTNEVRFISGLPDETDAAKLRVYTQPLGGGDVGTVEMSAAALSTDGAAPPVVRLTTGLSGVATNSAQVEAYDINLVATNDILLQPDDAVVVVGVMDATMRDGSVGTGTFRDSVQAQVAAVLAGMGHIERAESAQSIATGGSPTVVTWATSTVAGRGGISYSGGVFTLAEAGTYLTKVYTSFPNAGGARRQCQIRKNGTVGVSTNQSPPTTGVWSAETTEVLDYAAGDTIDVRVFQDSGGALTITGTITIHRLA